MFDGKSLSALGTAWFVLNHSVSWTHTAVGSNVWAVVAVVVRRNQAVDNTVTAKCGLTVLKPEGRIWLNNQPPSVKPHSFIQLFSGRIPAGQHNVTVTVSGGTRFSGEYRAACLTYSGIEKAAQFTTAHGTGAGTGMALPAVSGVAVFAHQATQPITAYSGTSRYPLDLFLSLTEGVVGDAAGVVTAQRKSGVPWCAASLELVETPVSNAAPVKVKGSTGKTEVIAPPKGIPVLTLAPAFFPMDDNHFRGELFRTPYKAVKVPYTNWPLTPFVEGGRDALDKYLHRYVGQKILVVGHSEGGQVVCMWLRDIGPTSDINPLDVTFIITGNLERKYNGIPGGGKYGGTGLPEDTPYRVIDIARQYDRWADWPNDEDNEAAIANVIGGGVHNNYSDVSPNPDDARNFSLTEGNVTYVSVGTYPAPLIDDNDFFATTTTLVPRDEIVRAEIEAAYMRPITIPDPPPSLTEEFPYGWDGTKWVRVSKASVEAPCPLTWWMEA